VCYKNGFVFLTDLKEELSFIKHCVLSSQCLDKANKVGARTSQVLSSDDTSSDDTSSGESQSLASPRKKLNTNGSKDLRRGNSKAADAAVRHVSKKQKRSGQAKAPANLGTNPELTARSKDREVEAGVADAVGSSVVGSGSAAVKPTGSSSVPPKYSPEDMEKMYGMYVGAMKGLGYMEPVPDAGASSAGLGGAELKRSASPFEPQTSKDLAKTPPHLGTYAENTARSEELEMEAGVTDVTDDVPCLASISRTDDAAGLASISRSSEYVPSTSKVLDVEVSVADPGAGSVGLSGAEVMRSGSHTELHTSRSCSRRTDAAGCSEISSCLLTFKFKC